MEEANRALVVSSLSVPISSVLEKLVGRILHEAKEGKEDGINRDYALTLDTKYYTAKIELWLAHIDGFSPPHYIPEESTADAYGEACQGLLLVFDHADASSFEKLKGWAKYAEDYGPAVQLCVAIQTGDHGSSSLVEGWKDWCVENGFEFIVAGLEDIESESSKGSGLLEEKKGRDRIVEALEANMWPCMQMKPRNTSAAVKKRQEYEDRKEKEEGKEKKEGENKEKEEGKEQETKTRLDTESLISQFDEEEDEIVRGLLSGKRAEEEREKKTKEKEEKTEESKPTRPEDLLPAFFKDLSVEDDDSFEKALSRLAGLREEAAKLPDDERREVAARVALMFASMLSGEDDDDEDD